LTDATDAKVSPSERAFSTLGGSEALGLS
jgi:hypothetical protein